jgi:hypothetical protein
MSKFLIHRDKISADLAAGLGYTSICRNLQQLGVKCTGPELSRWINRITKKIEKGESLAHVLHKPSISEYPAVHQESVSSYEPTQEQPKAIDPEPFEKKPAGLGRLVKKKKQDLDDLRHHAKSVSDISNDETGKSLQIAADFEKTLKKDIKS